MSFLKGVQRNSMRGLLEIGHSLIAEINRLCDMVPEDFVNPNVSKFKPIIADFGYFGDLSAIDKFVDVHEQGALLEDEFFFCFDKVIKRFGTLFESLANFFCDVVDSGTEFIRDHLRGEYSNCLNNPCLTIGQIKVKSDCVEVLARENSLSERNRYLDQSSLRLSETDFQQRQLKAEILYVTGVILIMLDEKFPLDVKQRLFVAHYRSNPATNERYELLVDMMKTKPANLEQVFCGLPINKQFANSIVTSVRSDGLFLDEHELFCESVCESRITRTQRSILFVCLCFTPAVLHSDYTAMRQIVDMYFADNWVISLHLGVLINVINAWENFKAANTALHQCVTVAVARKLSAVNASGLKAISFPHPAKISSADYSQCHNLIAAANLRLRWIVLHTYKGIKGTKRVNQLSDAVWSQLEMSSTDVFDALLQTANFEYTFKELYRNALLKKEANFNELKSDACQHVSQMAALFSNDIPLQKIKKNHKLQTWLLLVERTLSELDALNSDAPSLIEHLKSRIEQVSDIHDLSGNVAVDQYLQSISHLLSELSHCCALSEDFLNRIDAASDFSYGWIAIDQWDIELERLVEKDPLSVRSLFVKLSTSIGLTLTAVDNPARISGISLCYSKQLEARLRKILQVVPRSLFVLLDKIASLLDTNLKPSVLKTDLRRFVDADRRMELASSTYAISTLSLGISTMQLTWIGSLRVDPSALLLDGIKRELVSRICFYLRKEIAADSDVNSILSKLKSQFTRMREAFVYMSDHIGINGGLVWQSELTRVISYMLEKESNLFLKHPVNDEESLYQSKSVSIPKMFEISGCLTPLGHLYTLYVKTSDPKTTRYLNSLQVWCDLKTKKVLLSQESFSAAQDALSSVFLTSLDRLVCFHVVKHVNNFCDLCLGFITGPLLQSITDLDTVNELPVGARFRVFDIGLSRITPVSSAFLVVISKIGQHQLLRQRILSSVRSSASRNASKIFTAVDNLQKTVLLEMKNDCSRIDDTLLNELTGLLQQCAITDPLQKKYVKKECPTVLSSVLFLITLVAAPLLTGTKRFDSLDLTMFSVGVACLLTQFELSKSFFTFGNVYYASGIIPAQAKPSYLPIPVLKLIADYCLIDAQVGYHTLMDDVTEIIVGYNGDQVIFCLMGTIDYCLIGGTCSSSSELNGYIPASFWE